MYWLYNGQVLFLNSEYSSSFSKHKKKSFEYYISYRLVWSCLMMKVQNDSPKQAVSV